MPSVLLSGGFRLSSLSAVGLPANIATLAFSNTVTLSAFQDFEFSLATTLSEFVVSAPNFSNAQLVYVQADQIIRVNFGNLGNNSTISLASAGMQGTHFLWMGSALSGALNVHVGNSGTSAAIVRVLLGQ